AGCAPGRRSEDGASRRGVAWTNEEGAGYDVPGALVTAGALLPVESPARLVGLGELLYRALVTAVVELGHALVHVLLRVPDARITRAHPRRGQRELLLGGVARGQGHVLV